ncbi:MAG: phospholipase D family protein [Desulfomonilaceae bacterium]
MKTLFDRDIYDNFTENLLVNTQRFLWIATANIKMTVVRFKNRFVPFPDIMSILINRGVGIRIIHSELPSAPFRQRYDKIDNKGQLSSSVEFLYCPRMHAKIFIVDGIFGLIGSANLTGAGIGVKARNKRNFEVGLLLENEMETRPFMEYFDTIWMGDQCKDCRRKDICPGPLC